MYETVEEPEKQTENGIDNAVLDAIHYHQNENQNEHEEEGGNKYILCNALNSYFQFIHMLYKSKRLRYFI